MDEAGDVVWEVRPTSEDAWKEGLANAQKLVAMRDALAKNPKDELLAANVALLDASGRGQREKPSMETLAEHAKTEGADPVLVAKFEAMRKTETINAAFRKLREDKGVAVYELWKSGTAPDEGDRMALAFYNSAAAGAIESKNAADARKLVDLLKDAGKGNPRIAAQLEKNVAALMKQIAEIDG
jgi:hypothetical protein